MGETERLAESIKELLGGGRDDRLADVLAAAHAADVSSTLRELPLGEQIRVFRLLSAEHAGAVLSELDDQTQIDLIRALDEQEVSRILDHMPSEHVVEVVEELPKEEADKILDLMEEEKSEEVQELLEYGEGTAGRLMSTRLVAVHEGTTVAQAIEHIRKSASGDDAFYLYVVDDHDHLVGLVPLHRLLTADPATPVRLMACAILPSATRTVYRRRVIVGGTPVAVQVGDPFPVFAAPRHEGGTLDLGELRGKKNLVVFFFPKANTPG